MASRRIKAGGKRRNLSDARQSETNPPSWAGRCRVGRRIPHATAGTYDHAWHLFVGGAGAVGEEAAQLLLALAARRWHLEPARDAD